MENTKAGLILSSFEKYGSIRKVETLENKAEVYIFRCDLKKTLGVDLNNQLVFLVACKENNVSMFCFKVGELKNKEQKDRILAVVNKVNIETRYGKFILDDDGDINWEYSYDQDEEAEDIMPYLISCISGAKTIAAEIRMES